jgi:hypothetical protein
MPGQETDHSSPSIAKVKKAWSYTCTSPYVFILIKHKDNFTFYHIPQWLWQHLAFYHQRETERERWGGRICGGFYLNLARS